jgi:site-specific DNA recombinase
MERDLISERTKDALRHKISRNERAGQIPYGWVLAEDHRTLVRNDEEQRVIEFTKGCRQKGLSYRSICRELGNAGYMSYARSGIHKL